MDIIANLGSLIKGSLYLNIHLWEVWTTLKVQKKFSQDQCNGDGHAMRPLCKNIDG